MIFRNITYVALTNKMADTGLGKMIAQWHCLRCMAWIALTNKMAETCVSYASAMRQLYVSYASAMRQLCVSSRKHVKNL